jgi:hypothetical protein
VHDLGMARKVEGGGRSGRRLERAATGAGSAGNGQIGRRPVWAAPGAARSGGVGSVQPWWGLGRGEVRDDMWGPLA